MFPIGFFAPGYLAPGYFPASSGIQSTSGGESTLTIVTASAFGDGVRRLGGKA